MAAKPPAMTRVTPALIEAALAETDWARVDATTDAEIAAQAAADPDVAPILSETEHAASQVKTVRQRLNLTQEGFARRFHLPLGTIRDWEQGRRKPDAPAQALLRIIEREPDMAANALARATFGALLAKAGRDIIIEGDELPET